ncbi:MAG: MBOAT family protein [Lachnospiraceae bacterium]|nr:MBOAT family protein [Lachnospiraceae bacterium]
MSLLFYAWGEPKFVLLLLISICVNYVVARVIDARRDSRFCTNAAMTVMLLWNFGLFFVFKYLMFTMNNLNALFHTNWNVPNIALPIGISFFTFQAVSYVMDVKRKNCEVQKNIFDLALYIAFFPQLVAGPIVRYSTIEKQLRERKETLDLFYSGTKRFIVGFAKKIIMANFFGIITDAAFGVENGELTFAMAWLGGLGYSLQLYYDFSGYSDMAIGLGRMFGFEFEENFNYPYIAKSIREYWRRWHISLGAWFREYLFYPVTTSKWMAKLNKRIKNKFGFKVCRKVSVAIPLFITWMATGIWHGATWNYVIWGFYFSFLIILENLGFDKELGKIPKIFQHLYVTIIMLIARIIVRTSSVSEFASYMKAMLGFGNGFTNTYTNYIWSSYLFVIVVGVVFCIPVAGWLRKKAETYVITNRMLFILEPVGYLALFIVAVSFMVNSSYNPFIYFNF